MFRILFKFEHIKYIEGENYQMLNANKIMTKNSLKENKWQVLQKWLPPKSRYIVPQY